jgi:hypothetical protein
MIDGWTMLAAQTAAQFGHSSMAQCWHDYPLRVQQSCLICGELDEDGIGYKVEKKEGQPTSCASPWDREVKRLRNGATIAQDNVDREREMALAAGFLIRVTPWQEGFYAGQRGARIVDDWGGYPSQFVAGWDAGIAIWLRANSYWGA